MNDTKQTGCTFCGSDDHATTACPMRFTTIDREELARLRADSSELARVREPISDIEIHNIAFEIAVTDDRGGYYFEPDDLDKFVAELRPIPEGFVLVPVEQAKDSDRLAFMLTDCRKVVVESLMGSRYAVYVEEGFMADKQYPSVRLNGEWKNGSPDALQAKRRAIDLAMLAAAQQGAKSHE